MTPLACVALVLVSTLGARPDLPAPLAAAPVRLAAWAAAQLDVDHDLEASALQAMDWRAPHRLAAVLHADDPVLLASSRGAAQMALDVMAR